MSEAIKVMLAGKCEYIKTLTYPVMASYKLDGIRCVVQDGVLYSRNWKPIPNAHVQRMFNGLPDGTDGELLLGNPTDEDAYRRTVSAVMSEDGQPDVTFWVFDNHTLESGYFRRYQILATGMLSEIKNVKVLPHVLIHTVDTLADYEAEAVEAGHEGIMVNSDTPYKHGRSGNKKNWQLLKIKRFEDAEAKVTDTYEWQTNNNEATKNALGRTERTSHKDNKVGAGVLGGLNVIGINGPYEGVEFEIGTGFKGADDPAGERGELWRKRNKLVGSIVKYKFFPTGSKDKPRFPVFLGWRDKADM